MLPVGGRSLVLVAGIPGAGKSTLLRSLSPERRAGLVVVDSDTVREWLAGRLPHGTPYRLHRPLVHLSHRMRILLAVCSAAPAVLVHLPATAGWTRCWLAAAGLLARRDRTLVWFDVDAAEARRGQRTRGRVLAAGGFGRHARRAASFTTRLRAGAGAPGWRVLVVDRSATLRFAEQVPVAGAAVDAAVDGAAVDGTVVDVAARRRPGPAAPRTADSATGFPIL